MARRTVDCGYRDLAERINRFPQGAPESRLLFQILRMLFDEREAELVAKLPLLPFDAEQAAVLWGTQPHHARLTLERLATRGLLVDVENEQGVHLYFLPPPMAGFFEMTLMRTREDIDQKALSELFFAYINCEEDFAKALFLDGETSIGRIFVNEAALPAQLAISILDHERASAVIRDASAIGIGSCYCRQKMGHVGRGCNAPKEICMTFNFVAASLIHRGFARRADAVEALDLLQEAHSHGLVQAGENVRERVSFICNCCGCCCEALIAARRFGFRHPIQTTSYLPHVKVRDCNGCSKCVDVCPVGAASLVSANHPRKKKKRRAEIDESICLGCAVCVPTCPTAAITMEKRRERVVTPKDSVERVVLMALERGKLQHLVFDNQALASHRIMGRVLGAVLRLPPVKLAVANQQLRSRYLERLLDRKMRRARDLYDIGSRAHRAKGTPS